MIKQFIIYEMRKFKESFYSTFHQTSKLTAFLGQTTMVLLISSFVLSEQLFTPTTLFAIATVITWLIKEISSGHWKNIDNKSTNGKDP